MLDFIPLCDTPNVKDLIDTNTLSAAQKALQKDPNDVAALDELHGAAEAIGTALRAAVVERINTKDILGIATTVVSAGKDAFLRVYEAVWNQIATAEKEGSSQLLGVVGSLPASTEAAQTAVDAVQLLRHAATVKPKYDALLEKLLRGSGTQLDIPKVRHLAPHHLELARFALGWLFVRPTRACLQLVCGRPLRCRGPVVAMLTVGPSPLLFL
jgi:hypothetical protein